MWPVRTRVPPPPSPRYVLGKFLILSDLTLPIRTRQVKNQSVTAKFFQQRGLAELFRFQVSVVSESIGPDGFIVRQKAVIICSVSRTREEFFSRGVLSKMGGGLPPGSRGCGVRGATGQRLLADHPHDFDADWPMRRNRKGNRSHTCRVATPKTMKIGKAICAGQGRGSVEPV